MVLARHTVLPADAGMPRRLPARFVVSAAGISALSAVAVFMMSVLQEQQRYAAAAVEAYSLVQTTPKPAPTVTPAKTSAPPVKEQVHRSATSLPSPIIASFDLSRSRHWTTIGSLRLRVNKTDVKHGYCDLSVFEPGHRILNSRVFVAQRMTVPTQLGAPPAEIMVTSIGKTRVLGYVVGAGTEHRESSQIQPPKHHLLGG